MLEKVAAAWLGAVLLAEGFAIVARAEERADDYAREIAEWRQGRLARLTSEDGWLTLVGLHWLKPGENRFGSDPANEVVLPAGKAPALAGSFLLEEGRVRVRALPGSGLTLEGAAVGERELRTDATGEPDVVRLGELRFYVIERGGRFAVRVKDPQAATRREFPGLDYFPADPRFRVTADFVPYESPKEVSVPTVLGTVETMRAPGRVRFELDGRSLSLEPVLEDPGAAELFFIFKDATSGRETYPAGRYLYAPLPKDGKVVLDFNKAYNPPCAFTPYATCPYPPRENWLPVRIEAGEKYRSPSPGAAREPAGPAP